MTVKNYVVRFTVMQIFEVEVKANSEKLAKSKATKMFNANKDEYFSDSDTDVQVEEIYGY